VPGLADPLASVPDEVLGALRAAAERGARVASICVGAFTLAAAGLLEGSRATTHWAAAEKLSRMYPEVDVDADVLFVDNVRVWENLGRYRRIVYLHKTARIVMEEHDGKIPSDPIELIKLPGIGPYTAGAVACFAYERDTAFLDTNMRRVLHRYLVGLKAATTATDKELLQTARELLPSQRSWRWNQALMETGALLCTARSPRCEECPLREGCRARAEASSAGRPKLERKTPAYKYEDTNRYYRGRVLAELREISHGGKGSIGLRELGRRVRPDFDERDSHWLQVAVESLCKDGLARVSSGSSTARTPDMVTEERAPYSAGSEKAQSPSLDLTVSLP
jgi:A/G-specific adenine glycosylase